MPIIDGQRLLTDMRSLAEFGRWQSGVHRPTLSPQDLESRRWLMARMAETGLKAEIDGIGNVIGSSKVGGPRLLIGSHSDTQPYAGWLDGAMGVIYGIEVVRAFASDPDCAGFGVDVASWSDEEGQFSSFLGSRSFCDGLSDDDIDALRDRDDGSPLRAVLTRSGLERQPRAKIRAQDYYGYLEAHIEQGPVLDTSGQRLGIVTGIVGLDDYCITFEGEQNHAGSTPMSLRKDAGVALTYFANAIHRQMPEVAGPNSVWTIGRMTLAPGVKSVIPGHAEMLLQFRDEDPVRLEAAQKLVERLVLESNGGACRVQVKKLSHVAPMKMSALFQEALEAAAEQYAPGKHVRMPSGAGHDAQILAALIPAGMLFVPSIGGISHHPSENTNDEDLVLGCQVLATAAAGLAATFGRDENSKAG